MGCTGAPTKPLGRILTFIDASNAGRSMSRIFIPSLAPMYRNFNDAFKKVE
jgi:hypothetical protein